jgi:hypothetical protein
MKLSHSISSGDRDVRHPRSGLDNVFCVCLFCSHRVPLPIDDYYYSDFLEDVKVFFNPINKG